MKQYRMLILTDHAKHSAQNSLYALALECLKETRCAVLDVATRVNSFNNDFFKHYESGELMVSTVDASFSFDENGRAFERNLQQKNIEDYDVVWLRLPPPISEEFLNFLTYSFPQVLFVNDPKGINETGSKAFLMNMPELCPPMKLCHAVEDIIEFKKRFPIVLKPFREYGGKGIVKIDGDRVWDGTKELTFKEFQKKIENTTIEYLAVKFLEKVREGDKRIIVVHGQIIGASLRLPAKDSWICNVAMGGSSNYTEVDNDELQLIQKIDATLSKMGIVMYGVDTLIGDEGKRVLSEINTTSIGGLPQIEKLKNEPAVRKAVHLIWDYIIEKKTKT